MPNVKVVTDSAADLPEDLAAAHDIRVVPLTITFGKDSFLSGVDLSADQFWNRLRSSTESPATAAPSAGAFEEAYREAAAAGADQILSVHLSGKLSATAQSAALAAKSMDGVQVEVLDSRGVSATTALLALRGAELAASGADLGAIRADLESLRDRLKLFAVIDTLEYLRRGGRIGGAQALLGTMLQVKPVISIVDGVVEPVGRVRTRTKALQHLAGLVRADSGRIGRIIVVNGEAPDLDVFLSMLDGVVEAESVWTLGPVVGTHAGPGVIGVVYSTT